MKSVRRAPGGPAVPPLLVLGLVALGVAGLWRLMPDRQRVLERQVHDQAWGQVLRTIAEMPAAERAGGRPALDLLELQARRRLLTEKASEAVLAGEARSALGLAVEYPGEPGLMHEAVERVARCRDPVGMHRTCGSVAGRLSFEGLRVWTDALAARALALGDPAGAAGMLEALLMHPQADVGLVRLVVADWRQAGFPGRALAAVERLPGGLAGRREILDLRVELLRENGKAGLAFDVARTWWSLSSPGTEATDLERVVALGRESGRLGDLVEVLRVRAEKRGRDPGAWKSLCEAAYDAGRQREAVSAYRMYVELRPSDTAARLRLGQLLEWNGEPGQALDVYLALVKEGDLSSLSRLLSLNAGLYRDAEVAEVLRSKLDVLDWGGQGAGVVQLFSRLGEFESTLRGYERRLELRPKDYDLLMEYGQVLFDLQEFERALRVFDRASKERPLEVPPRAARADLLVNLGRYREAMDAYRALARETKDDALGRKAVDLAESLGQIGLLTEALEQRIAQGNAGARDYLRLANTHVLSGRRKDARRVLESGVKAIPEATDLRLQAAYAASSDGDYLDAARILEVHPGLRRDADAIELYVSVLVLAQDFPRASAFLATVENPSALERVGVMETAAQIYEANKRLKEALGAYERLFRARPGNLPYRLNYARLLASTGNRKDALALLRGIEEGANPDVLKRLAQVYSAAGDARRAEQLQRRYLATRPVDEAQAWGFLGDLLLTAGDRANARRAYQRGLDHLRTQGQGGGL